MCPRSGVQRRRQLHRVVGHRQEHLTERDHRERGWQKEPCAPEGPAGPMAQNGTVASQPAAITRLVSPSGLKRWKK